MKKVAVILSVYKSDILSSFQRCIDSLLEQSYPGNIDIWVQFDGEVDSRIDSYLTSVNQGTIYVNKRETNKGLAYSLNELLSKVLALDYEYIARMDADDICMQDRFSKQVSYLEQHSQVDILGGYIEEMDENEHSLMIVGYPLNHEEMRRFFGRRNPLAHVSVMFRRTYFEKAGLYPTNTDKDEDTVFWLNGFVNGCRFANIAEVLVRVRVSKDFYKRRNGFHKSYGDFKNRCLIIKKLALPFSCYISSSLRFLLFLIPSSRIIQLAYKVLRN